MLIQFEDLEAKGRTSAGTIGISLAFIDPSASRYILRYSDQHSSCTNQSRLMNPPFSQAMKASKKILRNWVRLQKCLMSGHTFIQTQPNTSSWARYLQHVTHTHPYTISPCSHWRSNSCTNSYFEIILQNLFENRCQRPILFLIFTWSRIGTCIK